ENSIFCMVSGSRDTQSAFIGLPGKSVGMPQGSGLGPLLWNVMYDGVLQIPMAEGTSIVAFADDVAVVIVAKTVGEVETLTNFVVKKVEAWPWSSRRKVETVRRSSRHLKENDKIPWGNAGHAA
ncbi:hypothetical protein KR067_005326, partial [Drosophila pandora]